MTTSTPPRQKYTYIMQLEQFALDWAKGLRLPNGDPLENVTVEADIGFKSGQLFVTVSNDAPRPDQLIPKQ